jgi:hypothetical protein
MNEVLNGLAALRSACGDHADKLHHQFGVGRGEPPLVAFGMLFNHATLTLEVCSWYYDLWGKLSSSSVPNPTRTIQENTERIIEQTKANFVFSLSAVEHVAKLWAKAHPNVLPMDFAKRQYLIGVIGKSHAEGLIGRTRHSQWSGLIKLRNAVIHNNAIADENLTVDFGSGFRVAMRDGQMIEGPLTIFVHLGRWTIEAYAEWCASVLQKA